MLDEFLKNELSFNRESGTYLFYGDDLEKNYNIALEFSVELFSRNIEIIDEKNKIKDKTFRNLYSDLMVVDTLNIDAVRDIIKYVKKTYNLLIGDRTAEDIKMKIGTALPLEEEETMEVKGRDLLMGLPKVVTITSEEVREAIKDSLDQILQCIRTVLEKTPPIVVYDFSSIKSISFSLYFSISFVKPRKKL